MRTAPISQIAELPGRRPVVSRSTTTYVACSSRSVGPGRLRERDGVAVPGEARIGFDDLGQERARERDGGLAQREQPPRRVLRGHRSAALLDEFHEPVGRV